MNDYSMTSDQIWNKIWEKDIYSRPKVRNDRARQKVDTAIKLGFEMSSETRLLEVGCGAGTVLIELAQQFPFMSQIAASDISDIALKIAKSNFDINGLCVDLYNSSIINLPFETDTFDRIIIFGVIEHVRQNNRALEEIERVLSPNGEAYFSTSNVLSTVYLIRKIREVVAAWPYGYQKNYSPSNFIALLEDYFEVISFEIVQTDFDFPFSAVVDRLLKLITPSWGRYIIVRVAKKQHS